ncbi:MAG: SCP2 sterol-binding domain-containing protein [Candidatus Njordarchaeales archaeon]
MSFEEAINIVKERFSDPSIKSSLSGFSKTILLNFPDRNASYILEIENGELKKFEPGSIEAPDVTITMDSETFVKVINKSMSPVKAYMTGKIKIKGSASDLLKLRKVLF